MTTIKTVGRAAMLLVGGALLTMLPAMAQDTSAPPPPPPPAGAAGPGGHGMGRGGPVAAALAQMNLTPDQQKVARDAQMDSMTKMKALRDDTTLDQKAKRKQMMGIMQDELTKIKAVLNDSQKTQLDAAVAQAREQRREGRGRGPGAGGDGEMPMPPPPPPAS